MDLQEDQNSGPFPRQPRPGSRTFSVVTNEYAISKLARVDLTLDYVIQDELDDYLNARDGSAELGIDADAFALAEDDRAIWEGPRLLAVIKPRAGGEPDVFRFDRGQPLPATDREREAWRLVGELGPEEAIHRLTKPEPPPPPPSPTEAEESILSHVRAIGEEESRRRLFLVGPYRALREACSRPGSDAVADLRRDAVGLDREGDA